MSFARLIALAIRNPLVTAASFVAVVMLFTSLMIVAYPNSGDEQALPVVEARGGDYKVSPDFDSGMAIAYEDSTVFGAVRGAEAMGGIENLLASAEEEDAMSLSKEELLAAQDANPAMNEKDLELLALLSEGLKEPATPSSAGLSDETKIEFMKPATQKLASLEPVKTVQKPLEKAADKVTSMVAPKSKPAPSTAQRLASLKSSITRDAKPSPIKTAPTSAISSSPKTIQISRIDPALSNPSAVNPISVYTPPKKVAPNSAEAVNPAGTSSETLQFVRSVLNQKDMKAAGDLNNIATAAGTTGNTAAANLARDRYVQLGSVRSADGGESEWAKLQKQFSAELQAAPHRLSQVDLGEKGVFYRIQAGPFTSAQASAICDSIKAQKSGGCLIVR